MSIRRRRLWQTRPCPGTGNRSAIPPIRIHLRICGPCSIPTKAQSLSPPVLSAKRPVKVDAERFVDFNDWQQKRYDDPEGEKERNQKKIENCKKKKRNWQLRAWRFHSDVEHVLNENTMLEELQSRYFFAQSRPQKKQILINRMNEISRPSTQNN